MRLHERDVTAPLQAAWKRGDNRREAARSGMASRGRGSGRRAAATHVCSQKTAATPRVSKSHTTTLPPRVPAVGTSMELRSLLCAIQLQQLGASWCGDCLPPSCRRRGSRSQRQRAQQAPPCLHARSEPRLLKAMHVAAPCSRYSSMVSGRPTSWKGSAQGIAGRLAAGCAPAGPLPPATTPHT